MNLLFVCLGNICRSPLAEAVMKRIYLERGLRGVIESAGTGGHHAGEGADPRSVEIGAQNGLDLTAHRARQVRRDDFERFDRIYAMDAANEAHLLGIAPAEHAHKVRRLRVAAGHPAHDADVPDPYYGGMDGFARVHAMLLDACAKCLDGTAK
jgi:protein-tyrosine phosphatase